MTMATPFRLVFVAAVQLFASLCANTPDSNPGASTPTRPLPISGVPVPALVAFDDAMIRFMSDRGIRSGALAVSRNGVRILSHGYGQASPETPFRIASVVKPMTAAAIRKLLREGRLQPDTRVFPLLGILPTTGKTADPRLRDITVQHLLDHRGGWDRSLGDPMFQSDRISKALGIPGPPTPDEIIRFMVGEPLQYVPGGPPPPGCDAYSNFGYCVLGRVIEKVTGEPYLSYLQRAILSPIDIHSVQLARTLPANRHPLEPVYSDPGTGPDVFNLRHSVPAPDGTFHIESMDSHGGLIAHAPDLIRFLDAYWMDGQPRKGGTGDWTFFGSLPGTWALVRQRPDGVNMAALFNQRSHPPGLKNETIREALDEAATRIRSWP